MEMTTEANEEVKGPTPTGRRSFVMAMFAVSGTVVGALLAIPLFRFATYPLRKDESDASWSDVGPVADFASLTAPVAKTITLERRDAWQTTSSQTAVYVLPAKGGLLRVLSPICPHLGCSVRWEDEQNKFICPCHSGSFTAEGERLGGPPPRSMDALETKVEDGKLKVRYQYFRQLVSNKEAMA
ncbi:ubiquinol-cytochrome c reductase iron-sulfur subunit [Granulicella sp. dw_53]|uniref:QcrA and Rieske domain-containing protein n=1 Tax=Granulicella sp. dw_53 TaxID=2719792 RepID=UPI001BD55C46|nr:ubiquinol-cytochrome c reductase iron-sulfur subunit [Granulicella sp. dw_53]